MGAIDAAAPEPVEVLIERAGAAVARAAAPAARAAPTAGGSWSWRARATTATTGGPRPRRLARRGVRVRVVDAADLPDALPPCDLVIDAAYGTGFRGEWAAPATDAPVLAVDIPSGVDGLTGVAAGRRSGRGARSRSPPSSRASCWPTARTWPVRSRWPTSASTCRRPGPTSSRRPTSPAGCPRRPAHRAQVAGRGPGRRRVAGHDRRRPPRRPRPRFRAGAGYVTLSSPGVDDDPRHADRGRAVDRCPRRTGPSPRSRTPTASARWPSARAGHAGTRSEPASGRWSRRGPAPWWSTATA